MIHHPQCSRNVLNPCNINPRRNLQEKHVDFYFIAPKISTSLHGSRKIPRKQLIEKQILEATISRNGICSNLRFAGVIDCSATSCSIFNELVMITFYLTLKAALLTFSWFNPEEIRLLLKVFCVSLSNKCHLNLWTFLYIFWKKWKTYSVPD